MSLPIDSIFEILKLTDKPFYVYDVRQIKDNYDNLNRIFKQTFEENAIPSIFKNYYAVKGLPNPHILRELHLMGYSNFDCASVEEIELLKYVQIPIDIDTIFFTSNYSSRDNLITAYQNNCIINFDSKEQFDSLYEVNILPHKICFRLNPTLDVTSSETSNQMSGSLTKFGIDEDDYIETYKYVIKIYEDKSLIDDCKFGIHCMAGSNIIDVKHWNTLMKRIVHICKRIFDEVNIVIDFINLGGGLGIPYKPNDVEIDTKIIANYVVNGLNEYIDYINNKDNCHYPYPDIYMENSRFVTGPYGWFVTNLQSIKLKSSGELFYGLNGSMADLMRPGMYGAYHHIDIYSSEKKLLSATENDMVNVVGTLCENNDWFARNRNLSRDAKIGDTIIFSNCGAHCRSMGFNYNSKLRPQEYMINLDGQIQLIRRSETFDDIVSTIAYANKSNYNQTNHNQLSVSEVIESVKPIYKFTCNLILLLLVFIFHLSIYCLKFICKVTDNIICISSKNSVVKYGVYGFLFICVLRFIIYT